MNRPIILPCDGGRRSAQLLPSVFGFALKASGSSDSIPRLGYQVFVAVALLMSIPRWTIAGDAAKTTRNGEPPAPRVASVAAVNPLLRAATAFDAPLSPTRPPTARENQALIEAIDRFSQRTVRDDFSALREFLGEHPESPWAPALETQLGYEYYRVGRYSRAIESWRKVWELNRPETDEFSHAIANRAGSELAMMYARLGRMAELRSLLPELRSRPQRGINHRSLRGAEDGFWSMENRPEVSFLCGPLALDRICFATDRAKAGSQLIQDSQSSTNGFSATQVAELSRRIGMNFQVAFRQPGAEVILPAVVHLKVGHYAALIARDGELLRADDPTFGNTKIWLSDAALEDEGSGYFLVRAGPLPPGWRTVPDSEADRIWGKGKTNISDPDATTNDDEQTCKDPNPNHDYQNNVSRNSHSDFTPNPSLPMAEWNVHLLLASHHVVDTPVGYTPPIGPAIYIKLSYNSVNGWPDFGLPHSNVSQEWRLNWLAYLTEDPLNPAGDIRFTAEGGGAWTFTDYDSGSQSFSHLFRSRAKLVRAGLGRYEIHYPDGWKKIFDQPDNSVGTLRKVFMSAVVDPFGNAATIQFHQPGHIASITDAIGQVTQFHYERPLPGEFIHPSVAWVPPFIVTKVVDPFGRTATFDYFSSINARLQGITDAIGIHSSFTYKQNEIGMTSLTTPYGTTTFETGSRSGLFRANWVEITHPNGEKERIEYSEKSTALIPSSEPLGIVPKGVPVRNFILWARNTYHWDRNAYARGYNDNDYTGARIYHWTHGLDYSSASPILESYKPPLEHRVWFSYEGQVNPTFVGTSDRPTTIARTVADGTTQLHRFEYNSLGNRTKSVDPLGRELTYVYAANEVDLVEIRQTRAGANEKLFSATYNAQHRPLTLTDAAGQTTRFGYNARGQVVGATNALGHVVRFVYDNNGYLLSVDGPLPGAADTAAFTYDVVGRVRTVTDQDGYTLTFDYDDIDRFRRVTFPDGTYEEVTYHRLDPEVFRDRAGRVSRLTYDALRQLVAREDPDGRVTRFDWCGCGGLRSPSTPLGRVTSWVRDLQGRVTSKVFADGSQVHREYDPATAWLKGIRDERNQITRLDYNLDGSLRQRRYFDAHIPIATMKLTYDPNYRRLLTREDGSGVTTYGYHPITANPGFGAGKLASVDGPLPNDTITYAYDGLGRVVSRAINGVGILRTWDEAGRLSRLTNVLGEFVLTWDGASSRVSSIAYPNGQTTTLSYHPNAKDRRLQQISHFRPNASLLSRFTYDYDAVRQITDWTQERAGSAPVLHLYDYDGADQLIADSATQGGGPAGSTAFEYDEAQNLLRETINGSSRELRYNVLDEPVAVEGETAAMRDFEWDAENRLVAFSQGTHRTEFSYDGLGRRTRIVERENGAVVSDRRYVWCGAELCEERDANGGQVLKRFTPYGLQAGAASGMPAGNYFQTLDHLGSVREFTDAAGQTRAGYDYTAYGRRTRISGDLHADVGFAGFLVHPASELNLARHRVYDANLARWLSRDLPGNPRHNLLPYVRNDPINLVDRFGLEESRPDLLRVETGSEFLDNVLGDLKSLWDKTPWAEKTTKPAEEFYDHAETAIEAYNDAEKISKLAGNCDIGQLHDPSQNSWDGNLKNSGREGLEILKIGSKWLDRLTHVVKGLDWVTGPATQLGSGVAEAGAGYIEQSGAAFGGATESGRRALSGRTD